MFSDPQFWVAIAFLIFIIAIFNPVRKILITSLDSKIKEIKNSLDEAESIKNQAQNTLSEIEKRNSEMEIEIKNIILNAEDKVNELQVQYEKNLIQILDKKKNLANIRIEQLVRDTNNSIQNQITSTALNTASLLINDKLDSKKKSELVNNSLKEFASSFKKN